MQSIALLFASSTVTVLSIASNTVSALFIASSTVSALFIATTAKMPGEGTINVQRAGGGGGSSLIEI